MIDEIRLRWFFRPSSTVVAGNVNLTMWSRSEPAVSYVTRQPSEPVRRRGPEPGRSPGA
jgi:hypothetical protein